MTPKVDEEARKHPSPNDPIQILGVGGLIAPAFKSEAGASTNPPTNPRGEQPARIPRIRRKTRMVLHVQKPRVD